MKNAFLTNSMNLIIKKNPNFDKEKLDIIKYGLEGTYLQVTKIAIIFLAAVFLNIFFEVILFLLIYNLIKIPSFGLHATKSWICLLVSSIIFLGFPILSLHITIPVFIKSIIASTTVLLIFKNTPADTHKRPIVSADRRLRYRFISTVVAIIFGLIAITIDNNFLSNLFISALIVQSFLTAPIVYKIFKQPYNNYLRYN